LFEAENYQLRT